MRYPGDSLQGVDSFQRPLLPPSLLAWMVNRDEFPAEPRLALSVPLFELEKDFHCEQLN